MQCRAYQSKSIAEGIDILGREWSRHRLSLSVGSSLHLRFSIRSITPDLSLSSLIYGAPVTIEPEERAEVLLLQFPRSGAGLAFYKWGHAQLDSRHFGVIDVRSLEKVHYGSNIDMLVVRISMARVMNYIEQILGRKAVQNVKFSPQIALGTAAWNAWSPVLAALDAVSMRPHVEFPYESMRSLELMVLSTLVMTQPSNYLEELTHPRTLFLPRHIRKAEAFIKSNLSRSLTSSEIAQNSNVSTRSLFDGFRDYLHTTPAAFAREARLKAARDDLLKADDSIAVIARRWGYSHSGHFARQYKRVFGEAPTHTVAVGSIDK